MQHRDALDVIQQILPDAAGYRVVLYLACKSVWQTTAEIVHVAEARCCRRTLRTAQRELVRLERLGLVERKDVVTGRGHTNIWRTTERGNT